MHLTIIVPTKDRPEDMRKLLESIKGQERAPDNIIIVDGSDNPIKHVLEEYPEVTCHYVQVRPPSLPKQRNAGIQELSNESEWVGFLDDDIVLEPDCLKNLEQFITKHANEGLVGAGLSILNQPKTNTHIYNNLFLLGQKSGGKLTPSGFPSAIPTPQSDMNVNWLYGGATFWRKDIFDNFLYDEWFQGTGYMEDVDFSYHVSKKYKLMISSDSKCYHYHHGINKTKEVGIGEWQIVSWWYFIRKYRDFNTALVFWGMIGVSLKNLLNAIATLSSNRTLRVFGNLKGFIKIFTGKALEKKGFSK
jgi:glycosyltransferase involved in cell wall biosynthesis